MSETFTSPALAYATASFLGAKVRSFTTGLGWSVGSPSQLTVNLVDDPTYGSVFAPPAVGTPVYFSAGAMSFNGLFQKWERRRDQSGDPVYEVVVVDPREILEGAQVVVSEYSGTVSGVANLFNAYGYWENVAYGASGSTDAGMPWASVASAVTAMCNSPAQTPYGGPLTYRGYSYGLDLSQLPVPPIYYRLGGPSIGLLEAIAQICEDGGYEFFVDLVGSTIRIRTVSRRTQPPLGTIDAVTNTNYGGTVSRSTSGLEARNELTSAFLVGGDVSTLWTTNSIQQFWGYDILGNPIVGVPTNLVLKDVLGKPYPPIPTQQMNLNAAPVADIVGAVIYQCTTVEMRMAQAGIDVWNQYINTHRPQIAARANGLPGAFLNMNAAAIIKPVPRPNFVNDKAANAQLALQGDAQSANVRLYEFVRGYADEYMGRKFLVALPFILAKTDPETLQVTTSWEVTDAGYVGDGDPPLGLAPLNADVLSVPDGRFRPFMVFGNIAGVDLSKVPTQGVVIQNGLLYQECQVDPQLVYLNGPMVVASLNGPVVEREVQLVGDPVILGAAIQLTPQALDALIKKNSLPFRIAPATRVPDVAAVALKSNVLTYGPWAATGAPGKVRFDQDPGLTPWAYGGYDTMNQAGTARVATAITNMQVSETGTLELAGAPTCGLGDILQAGGPNVTGLDVSWGVDGVTTSYRFQTFTPRFGIFAKGQIERMKRLALANVELRRNLRVALREDIAANKAVAAAVRADKAWRANQAAAFKKQTPHDVFQVYCLTDDDGNTRVHPALGTMEESIFMSSADDSGDYQQTAMMSLGGLVRPFGTGNSFALMPGYTTPTITGSVANKSTLDPWKDLNDIEVFAYGPEYDGCHAFRREVTGSDARTFGLRGPLVVVGWGFAKDTTCVPGGADGWDDDYLTHSETWKTGPVDLLWDQNRGVWTCHGTVRGTLSADLAAGSSATMAVQTVSGYSYNLTVYNQGASTISSGTPIVAAYIADDNRWYAVNGASGGGGGGSGTVTSVDCTQPDAGLTITGGPITSSGTFTFALADDLAALEGLSGAGIAVRTGTSTWTVRAITGTTNQINVTNGDGVAGQPTLALAATAVTAGSYGSASSVATFTVDAYGRLTAASNAAIAVPASSVSGLAPVATGGAYSQLTGTPSLGTAAAQNASYFAQVANNLSDLTNAATARTNLGLGTAATYSASTFDAAGAASSAYSSAVSYITSALTSYLQSTTAASTYVAQSTLGVASGVATLNSSGYLASAQMPAFTGNVTSSAGGTALTIAAGVVTNAMLAGSIATSKITGLAASATTDTTNASNITSGTLTAARLPAQAVVTTGTYSSPAWLTGIAWSIIGGTPTTLSGYGVSSVAWSLLTGTPTTVSGYGITDAVTLTGTQTLTNKTLTAPTMTTPVLGTPTSGNLANCTFPTLNQNTTGTAANVTGTVAVANGGTGLATATAYAVLCGGTTSTGVLQQVSGVGTTGQVLTSNGASTLPSWQSISTGPTPAAPTITATAGNAQNVIGITPGTGATNTYVYRGSTSSVNNLTGTLIYSGTGTSYTDTGLTNGTTYYYIGYGWNNNAFGPASSVVGATPAIMRYSVDMSAQGLGGTSIYASRSDTGAPSGNAARAVSLWIKFANVYSTTNSQDLFVYGTNAGSQLFLPGQFNSGWDLTISGPYISGGSVSANTWYHVVATYNGTTATIYVNGSQVATGSISASTVLSGVMGIGGPQSLGSGGGGTACLDGKVTDVRLYTSSLTLTQVGQLYNSGTPTWGTDPTGVAKYGWWQCQDGSGSTLSDSSGNSRPMTLTGAYSWSTDVP